jgi:hypothetical protein
LGLSEYEVDEFWTTIKKNRRSMVHYSNTRRENEKRGASRASNATPTSSPRSPSATGARKPARG